MRRDFLDAFDHAGLRPSDVHVRVEEAFGDYIHGWYSPFLRLIDLRLVSGGDEREEAAVLRHELEHVRQLGDALYEDSPLLQEYVHADYTIGVRCAGTDLIEANYVRIPMEVSANMAARDFNGTPLGLAGEYIPPGEALLNAMRLWSPRLDVPPFQHRPSRLGVPA